MTDFKDDNTTRSAVIKRKELYPFKLLALVVKIKNTLKKEYYRFQTKHQQERNPCMYKHVQDSEKKTLGLFSKVCLISS